MDPISFAVAAKILGLGTASGTRAALVLALLSGMGRLGYVAFPEELAWLASTPAVGLLLGAALLEEFLERDDDAQQLLGILKYGVHGTGAVVTSYVLVDALDLPWSGWPLVVIGGLLALGTHGLRMRLHAILRDFEIGIVSPRTWLTYLEVGGVMGVVASVVLAPILALVLVLLAGALALAIGLSLRAIERRSRRACLGCDKLVRKEARLCPHCQAPLEVAQWRHEALLYALRVRVLDQVRQKVT